MYTEGTTILSDSLNFSTLLLDCGEEEEGFVVSVGKHLVNKLVREKNSLQSTQLNGEKHPQGAQLLRGLSVLCECQGAPVEQNQSEL